MKTRATIDLGSLRRLQERRQALRATDLFSYSDEVRSVMVSPVQTCAPEENLRTALKIMAREGVSSLVVVDPGRKPVGILTDRDVVQRIAGADGVDVDATVISQVMTPHPVTLRPSASVYRALYLLTAKGIKHLPLVEEGRVVGIVTMRHLMKLRYPGPVSLIESIAGADGVAALAEVYARLPRLAASKLSMGMRAHDVVVMISLINQDLHRKAFELALAEAGPPPTPCCLYVTGSHGRRETLLTTDQDYGLVIADFAGRWDEADDYYAAVAATFTGLLERIGFVRCPGQVMATNPIWRRSVSGFKQQLDDWFSRQVAHLGRYVTVFYDAAPIWGTARLFDELNDHAFELIGRHHEVLRILHEEESGHRVPTGLLGRFVTEGSGPHRGEIDIKRSGLRFVVEGVRILALLHGVRETATVKRIAGLVDGGHVHPDDGEFFEASFRYLLHFALEAQVKKAVEDRELDTYLNPRRLSPMNRQALRHAYKGVTSLQGLIASEFGELVL